MPLREFDLLLNETLTLKAQAAFYMGRGVSNATLTGGQRDGTATHAG
jgi:hypothetical protein